VARRSRRRVSSSTVLHYAHKHLGRFEATSFTISKSPRNRPSAPQQAFPSPAPLIGFPRLGFDLPYPFRQVVCPHQQVISVDARGTTYLIPHRRSASAVCSGSWGRGWRGAGRLTEQKRQPACAGVAMSMMVAVAAALSNHPSSRRYWGSGPLRTLCEG